jgi:predicted house-cleaning NTP pyrophosphatase (Maf/HAM1 superfamily)
MSTPTTPEETPRAQARATASRKPRAKRRPLPQRALLVQLGTVDAVRERLATATKPLRPAEARERVSSLRARVADTLSGFERRGERTNADLQRQVKHARTGVERQLRRGRARAGV